MSRFIVSLDFELWWGVRDSKGESYDSNLYSVYDVVPVLLNLFNKYEIGCTWAIVGGLMAENMEEFYEFSPIKEPSYKNKKYSPFLDMTKKIKTDERLVFAPSLVEKILSFERQEVASHTFSHYYCLEEGQVISQFKEDSIAISAIANNKFNISLQSLVFPRNQFNQDYLEVCKEVGILSYRGNSEHWAYSAASNEGGIKLLAQRLFRILDAYVPLNWNVAHSKLVDGMVNVPASMFLRPWNKKFRMFELLRLKRIQWSIKQTAKKGGDFHLWWHPHNFGENLSKNIEFLEEILKYYIKMKATYGMKSMTMKEVNQDIRGDAI